MSSGGSKKLVGVAAVWLVLLFVGVAAYKLIYSPWMTARDIDETSTPATETGGATVTLALDSFSGYAIFRSEEFRKELALEGLSLRLEDDNADYGRRLRSLQRGDVDLAVFTIDALIKTSAEAGELPATIVQVIDETRGADAMIASKQAVPDVDALNRSDARIVRTPDSPSDTLARVVIAHFNLPRLDARNCWIDADSAEDVFRRFRSSGAAGGPRAFVLWEPYVSKALESPDAHVLVDSSRFKGYIVDVLVAGRKYLIDNESRVESFIKAYLRAAFTWNRKTDGIARLVLEDARALDQTITEAQARKLVEGIWWKNTQENYAHLGILPPGERGGLQYLQDMVENITRVLVKTGVIEADPTGGQPNKLFYNRLFAGLHERNFFPGLIAGVSGSGEAIRDEIELPSLRDDQWEALSPVGTLEVERLVFARGTARLTARSRASLEDLAATLRNWPLYYLEIRGHALSVGDPEANRRLARDRSRAAADFLIDAGIPPERLRAVTAGPSADGENAPSVTFVVGQVPY